jgi:hypothetical protein
VTITERSAIKELVAALLEQTDDVIDAVMAQMRAAVPELYVSDDPAYLDTQKEHSDGVLRALWNAVSHGDDAPRIPEESGLRETELMARLGIGLDVVELGYREWHRVVWEYAVQTAQDVIEDPRERAAALAEVSTYLYAWVENTLPQMAAAWERGRHTLWVDRERRKSSTIQAIIAGKRPPPEEIDGYVLATKHVCVIAWGRDPHGALTTLGATRRNRTLEMLGLGSDVWTWLAVDDEITARLAAFIPEAGTRIAIGRVEEGPEGFRRTALQAQAAYEVGVLERNPVVRHEDVAIVALALRDPERAKEFVTDELGALASDDPRSALMRETLRAYFSSGANAAAAGARLGVHDRTVAYRLQTVERNLLAGRSINTRRDELDLALRLHRLLRGGGVNRVATA